MASKVLIIKASCDICKNEIDHIETIAKMFGLTPEIINLVDMVQFQQSIFQKGPYQYIYLCTHASPYSFGEADGSKLFSWEEFAQVLCATNCLDNDAILLLACCRGGLKKVADTLFLNCENIDYVCGPRWKLTGADISTGFHVFIYNVESRKEQPSIAVDRSSKATGYDFFCYDRVESEDEVKQATATIIQAVLPESVGKDQSKA